MDNNELEQKELNEKNLEENKLRGKRILSYIVDVIIVTVLIYLIGQIKFLNPNYDKYVNAYNEYVEYYEQNLSNTSNVSQEDLMTDEYKQITYDLSYYGMSNMIITAGVIVLYFVLFPLCNHSQTIGKRLFKLMYVKDDDTNVKWYTYLLRSLLLPVFTSFVLVTPLTYIFEVIGLLVGPNIYIYVNMAISLVFCIYGYIDIIVLVSSKNGKSLHDIITKTKVIESK